MIRELGAGNREQGAGSREQEAGNGEQGLIFCNNRTYVLLYTHLIAFANRHINNDKKDLQSNHPVAPSKNSAITANGANRFGERRIEFGGVRN